MEDNNLDTTISKQIKVEWNDLSTDQKNCILSLALSQNPTQASQTWRKITKYKDYKFWMTYRTVKDIWKEMVASLPTNALMILQGGSIAAALEIVSEVKHKDVKIRNKASNDILEKVLPKTPSVMQQFNVGQGKEGNNITFVNFNEPTGKSGI